MNVDSPASPDVSDTVNLRALFRPVSDLINKEYVPSPLLIIFAETPSTPFNVFATVFNVAPELIVTVLELFEELDPKVAALCPTVT